MKKTFFAIFSIILLLMILAGCEHPVYQFWIKGVNVYPSTVIEANQECSIELRYTEITKPTYPKKEWHWQIPGYEEEFVTDRIILSGIKFDTSGMKTCYVYTVCEDKEVLVNDFHFGIEVKEVSVTQIK